MKKWIWLAWVAVIVMTIVSGAFNFTFGWRLGENSHSIFAAVHDGYIYGALSIAVDGFKIAFGILTVAFFLNNGINPVLRVLGGLLCGVLWLSATTFALNSAFGSIATNRTDMAGIREAKSTNYTSIQEDLAHAQEQRKWLEKHRAADTVNADMARERQSHLWARSGGCSNATVDESRGFCQRYSALLAEEGTARRDEALSDKIEELRKKLSGAGGKMIADPHAQFMHDLTGYSENGVILGWMILLVLIVEGGSTLGPIGLWLVRQNLVIRPVALATLGRGDLKRRAPLEPATAILDAPIAFVETPKEAPPVSDPFPKPAPEPKPVEVAATGYNPKPITAPPPKLLQPEMLRTLKLVHSMDEVFDDLPSEPPAKGRTLKKSPAKTGPRKEGTASDWIGQNATLTGNKRDKTPLKTCWKSYLEWCEAARKKPLGRNKFSRALNVITGQNTEDGVRSVRDGRGNVVCGIIVDERQPQRLTATG